MPTRRQAPITNLPLDVQHQHPRPLLYLYRPVYTVVLFRDLQYVVQHTTHLFILPPGLPVGVRHGDLVHIRQQRLQTHTQ